MGLLNRYFDRFLGLAIGIGYIGTGVGQIIGPPLFVYLVGEYGLKGTLLIWGGIQLNLCVCAFLMRPTSFYTKWNKHQAEKGDEKNNKAGNLEGKKLEDESKKTKLFDKKLFRNGQFILFDISLAFTFMAYIPMAALIIPAHGDQVGLSPTFVALLSTVMGVTTTIGRPLLGFAVDLKIAPTALFLAVLCFVSGILVCVIPHVGSGMALLSTFSGVVGFTTSAMMTVPANLLGELVEPHQYTVACGWMGIFMGLPNLYSYSLYGKCKTTYILY